MAVDEDRVQERLAEGDEPHPSPVIRAISSRIIGKRATINEVHNVEYGLSIGVLIGLLATVQFEASLVLALGLVLFSYGFKTRFLEKFLTEGANRDRVTLAIGSMVREPQWFAPPLVAVYAPLAATQLAL